MTVAEYAFRHADHVMSVTAFGGALLAGMVKLHVIEALLFALTAGIFTLIVAALRPPDGRQPWRGPQQ